MGEIVNDMIWDWLFSGVLQAYILDVSLLRNWGYLADSMKFTPDSKQRGSLCDMAVDVACEVNYRLEKLRWLEVDASGRVIYEINAARLT
jgi:hypothetical protein